jgi:8-oxo-dGTP pyrophosphatase MutT (NUDIX family)/GNAT superfamily N-acetyltransferase
MAVVVKAPNPWQKGKFTLFLSGVIDQDTAPDWQAAVIKALDAYDITILSPRRDDWDSSWEAEIENPKFVEQVAWESRGLSEADYRTFVVFKDSKAPITMLEFGKHIDDPGCLMVEDGFYREGNLEFEAIAHKMPVYYSLEEMITAIRVILDEKGLRLKTAKLLTRRAEKEIESTTEEDAYWAGEGNAASGILAVAKDTHRLCLAWRNQKTHTGDCWGLIGGAVQKEKSPGDSAAAEMREEVGYTGPVELHAGYVFTDQGFSYHNFVGITGSEFPFNPHSDHAWETDFIKWKTLEEWQEEMDTNAGDFHPGVITFFEESADLIASVVGDKRITAKLLTRQAANVKVASPEDLGYLKHYLTMPKRAMGEELARYAPYEFKQYVEQTDPTASGLFDEDEYIDDYTAFDDDILIGFLETFEMHDHVIMDPYAPTFLSVRYDRDIHDEWLVHFSDDAASIAREGFKYGVSDPGRLAVTTNFGKDEKEGGGYNFAFTPDDVFQHEDGRWGKHCVVFKASGIETTHVIDEFTQVIFWGADAHSIVLVSRRNDAWEIRSRDGKKVLFSGELNQAIAWVEKNAVKVLNNAKPVEASAEFALGDRNKAAGGGGRDTESKTAQKKRWPDPTHTSDSLTYQVEDGDEGAFTIWALPSNTAERSQRVGYIEIQVPDDLFGKSAGVLYVLDVAVEDEWRGTGLGQRLYDMAIEKAKSEGARYLTSSADQTPDAKAAWRRLKQRYPVRKKDGLSYIKLSSSQADGSKVATDAPIQDQDVDRTALTETPAFKAWFGNSKVVDDHGRPLVVYHGADKIRSVFKPEKGTRYTMGTSYEVPMTASFFTPNKSFARSFGKALTPAFLKITKPLDLREGAWGFHDDKAYEILKDHFGDQVGFTPPEELWDILDQPQHTASLRDLGYDGLIFVERDKEGDTHETYAVFDSTQAKSATRNSGAFDASNPKITASAAPTQDADTSATETPAFKAWFAGSKVVDDHGRPLRVFHGTRVAEDFESFDTLNSRDLGSHFGTPEQASFVKDTNENARVIPVYLSIKNPLRLPDLERWDRDSMTEPLRKAGIEIGEEKHQMFYPNGTHTNWERNRMADREQIMETVRQAGYDGIVYSNSFEGGPGKSGDGKDSWIAFKPSQVKSAIGNSGEFSAENNSITAAKTAYLSPKEAELTVTIDRTARHLVAISLDLGIPRFTRFAITIPVQDMPGEEVLEYAHQAFSALVDEVLLFMVSLSYDEQEMVLFTKLVTKCWESLNMEDASDAGMNGSDPVLRMYEASFDIPASFVEETHTRVVTAKSVSRLPNVRKLQLVDVRPDPMDTTPARTIRMFRNRSLKSMPKPFYILVYDQKGRVRGTVPLARNWESRLIKQV